MNLKTLDNIKAQIDGLSIGSAAELAQLKSTSTPSVDTIHEVEASVQQSLAKVSSIVSETTSKVINPIKSAITSQIKSIAGPLMKPLASPLTDPLIYGNAHVAKTITANVKLAMDTAQVAAKMAQITAAASKKTAEIQKAAQLVAAAKAKLSPEQLTQLSALPSSFMSGVKSQVASKKASLDQEFVRKIDANSVASSVTP